MSKSNGFTLIELLIVVAIIGILAAIAVPNFLNAQVRAKLARTYGDLKANQTAIGLYTIDHNFAPPFVQGTKDTGDTYRALTTPISYLGGINSCRDPFASKQDDGINAYFDYGAPLYAGSGADEIEMRKREYGRAALTYVQTSAGPDRVSDWPWTNFQAGIHALHNPSRAGLNQDGGVFFTTSNGLNSQGDIVASNASIYQ